MIAQIPPDPLPQLDSLDPRLYQPQKSRTTPWRQALIIAAVAIVARAIICASVLIISRTTLSKYADLYDGRSYLINARAIEGDWSQFDGYQGRVFPGFPAMIALLHRFSIPNPAAAVALNWIGAAVAAGAAVLLFQDIRVGCATAVLMPHYLMNSSLALSEAPMLGLSCLGLLLLWPQSRQRRLPLAQIILGGLLLGAAGVVRPMACFAAIAFGVVAISNRRMRDLALVIVTSAGVVLLSLILSQHWRGDALAGIRFYANSDLTYGGQLLSWPFHSLITVSISGRVPPQRIFYIWLHVGLVLAACALAVYRLTPIVFNPPALNSEPRMYIRGFRGFDEGRGMKKIPPIDPPRLPSLDLLAGIWLLTNTSFVLCIGSVWGFQCFHRFAVPAFPAMFWILRKFLPRGWIAWSLISAASIALAVLTIVNEIHAGSL